MGLGLVLLLEYRDRSLRTETDVVGAFALPVLALVPTMMGVVERAHAASASGQPCGGRQRRRGRARVVAWRLGLVGRWL